MLIPTKKTAYLILFIAGAVLLFSACEGKSSKDEVIKTMEANLLKCDKAINNSTATMLKELSDKSYDPAYSESRTVWFKKAENIAKICQNFYQLIDSTKRRSDNNNFSVATLHQKLINYKQDILNIDSSFTEHIPDVFEFVDSFSALSYSNQLSSKLSLLQNDVKLSENKIIAFCNTKVGIIGDWFTSYSALVGQNSNYVKPGEEVIINAGVGAYSKSTSPVININGKDIPIGEEGFARYKIKSSKNPGNYTIPVRIDFRNPYSGKIETNQINVEYTVAQPCN